MPGSTIGSDVNGTESDDWYCDANNINGNYCAEVDIQEANMGGFHVTPHKCTYSDGSNIWSSDNTVTACDGNGSAEEYSADDYGYGKDLDMSKGTANFYVDFVEDSEGEWSEFNSSLTTANSNNGKTTNTDASYLNTMTTALPGMTIVLSRWGSTSDMGWLTGEGQCGTSGSSTNAAGETIVDDASAPMIISNLSIKSISNSRRTSSIMV
jgi:hypothetical protein